MDHVPKLPGRQVLERQRHSFAVATQIYSLDWTLHDLKRCWPSFSISPPSYLGDSAAHFLLSIHPALLPSLASMQLKISGGGCGEMSDWQQPAERQSTAELQPTAQRSQMRKIVTEKR